MSFEKSEGFWELPPQDCLSTTLTDGRGHHQRSNCLGTWNKKLEECECPNGIRKCEMSKLKGLWDPFGWVKVDKVGGSGGKLFIVKMCNVDILEMG